MNPISEYHILSWHVLFAQSTMWILGLGLGLGLVLINRF